jgi:Domain of unknown function (DUF5071)
MATNRIVPIEKDDQLALHNLRAASKEQVLAVADDLLEWLEDGNWPVSLPIGKVLSQHVDDITPNLVQILRSYDSLWKYWCIRFLLMQLDVAQIPVPVIAELNRIVRQPTASDVNEGASEAAAELLSGDYQND